MQSDEMSIIEETTERTSSYPSTSALRVGIIELLIGLGGIACAIATQFIQLNLDNTHDLFLYGGLALGFSALFTGIIAVVSGKAKSGCCLIVTLMVFSIITTLLSIGLAINFGIIFVNIKQKEDDRKIVNVVVDNLAPDNPYTKDRNVVQVISCVLLVLSSCQVLLALFLSCFACKGVCCVSNPYYMRRTVYHYPIQPRIGLVVSSQNQSLYPPVYAVDNH